MVLFVCNYFIHAIVIKVVLFFVDLNLNSTNYDELLIFEIRIATFLCYMSAFLCRLNGLHLSYLSIVFVQVPVDLVIDHSVQVDVARKENAVQANMELEFQRNKERFAFLKWGSNAFHNMLVVPPGSGIVHQVN